MKDKLRSLLFFIFKHSFDLFIRLTGPMLKRKHRLNLLLFRLREAMSDFLCPTQPIAVSSGTVQLPVVSSKPEMPDFIWKESRAIHEIEPLIFPLQGMRSFTTLDFIPAKPLMGMHYMKIREIMGDGVSHVLMVPWMKQGGADLVTMNFANVLVSEGGATGVVVITTEDSPSPWASKLPEGVRFVEFGRLCNDISPAEQEKLMARIILQVQPKMLHILNSDLGYRMVENYGKSLKAVTTINVSVFCADFHPSGHMVGYPTRLNSVWDAASGIYCDTEYWRDRLRSIYAFEPDKLHVHYQPAMLASPRRKTSFEPGKAALDILWASRIDNQKRPDILIEVARRCQDMPFTFHVYGIPVCGTSEDEIKKYMSALTSAPNIKYLGEFNGTDSLPIESFDLMLYTSQWDGLPLVLLDAMVLGLPILASKVGGVPEVIIDGQTGFLVDPFDSVDVYVSRLKAIYADPDMLKSISDNAYELVRRRHSRAAFVETLRNTGYLK